MRKLSFFLLATIGLWLVGDGQIQVSQEPRHHKLLDNGWVRVLDVHIPPHDTTIIHKHSTPSVFVVLTQTKTGSEVMVEPGRTSFASGNIWFEGFYDRPRIHRVWNEDTAEFHVMDIELLHTPAGPISDVDSLPFCKSLFDAKPVHAFKMTLEAKERVQLNALAAPVLIIGLSGPADESLVNGVRFTKKGDFLFVPAGTWLKLENKLVSREQQFALFYLK